MVNYLWAVSPSIFILIIVYLIDKFREPKSTVVVSFLLGCGFVLILYFLKIPFQFLLNSYSSDDFWDYWIWTMYMEAGFLEEACKFGVLYLYCLKYKNFNEPMDAIVYGVAVSLGFSAYENIAYVDSEQMRYVRIVPTLMHASTGIIMGLLLSKFIKFEVPNTLRIYLALIIPIIMHGTYNIICLMQDVAFDYKSVAIIYFIIGMLIILITRNKQKNKIWEEEYLIKHDNKYFVRSALFSFISVLVLCTVLSFLQF